MDLSRDALLKIAPIISGLRVYHRHSLEGKSSVPPKGPAIFAVNHSLASYDIALLMAAIYEEVNRVPRALIDRLFFKVPGLGSLMEALGSREGTHDNAVKLLQENELLILAPGGMRESLRPSTQRHQIIWGRRKGFVKLSIESGAPIILAACPAADHLYDIAPSHITAWAYQTFKIPIPFAKGAGLSPLPKPIALTHHLSEPLHPPPMPEDKAEFATVVDDFHRRVCERMNQLMTDAVEKEKLTQKSNS
jgi:hypothetical protein